MHVKPGVGQKIVGWLTLILIFAGMWALFAFWVHQRFANWTVAGIASGAVIAFFVQQIFFDELFGGRGEAVWKVLDWMIPGEDD